MTLRFSSLRLVRTLLFLAAVGSVACGPAAVLADAEFVQTVEPSDEILLDEPSVLGLINDGDQSVVETVYLYMDGCPLLSITPPEGGRGKPQVTVIETEAQCVPVRGTRDPAKLAAVGGSGMRVQLWKDDPSSGTSVPVEDEPEEAAARSLVVEIASLYPRDALAGPDRGGETLEFFVPGFLGNPSGDLVLAAEGGAGDGGLFGSANAWPNSGGGTGGAGGFAGGPGGGGGGGTGFLNMPNLGDNLPSVTSVPLPATLLLLLWALQLLRSYVRRT